MWFFYIYYFALTKVYSQLSFSRQTGSSWRQNLFWWSHRPRVGHNMFPSSWHTSSEMWSQATALTSTLHDPCCHLRRSEWTFLSKEFWCVVTKGLFQSGQVWVELRRRGDDFQESRLQVLHGDKGWNHLRQFKMHLWKLFLKENADGSDMMEIGFCHKDDDQGVRHLLHWHVLQQGGQCFFLGNTIFK